MLSLTPAVVDVFVMYMAHDRYLTSMLELGALLGSLLSPHLADTHSRRFSLFIGLIFFIVGSMVQTLAGAFGVLVGGRLVGGVGIGVLSSTAPMYVSEVSGRWGFCGGLREGLWGVWVWGGRSLRRISEVLCWSSSSS